MNGRRKGRGAGGGKMGINYTCRVREDAEESRVEKIRSVGREV